MLPFLLAFITLNSFTQEIEKADNSKSKALPLIHAFVNSTFKGNSITNFSDYNIDTKKISEHTIILKMLKNKFLKNNFVNDSINYNENLLGFEDSSANNIIKNVIKNRQFILDKSTIFTTDFYTKNRLKIKNAPKKIMGIALGDFNGGLDSTRSGIIYLSETLSKIIKREKEFKEHILAVKVNGIDTNIGFNRAINHHYNFYQNTLTIGDEIVSPIAQNAFNFYQYKLEETFKIDAHTIYKIKVIPKRKIDNVFNGYVYIVANHWQLYKLDLQVLGKQIQQPNIDFIKIEKQFYFSIKENLWLSSKQNLQFKFNQHGIKIEGFYFANYKNYNFNNEQVKKQLNNTVFSIDKDALNKKTAFWKNNRPIKLLSNEHVEYEFKDRVFQKRNSKPYLDSLNTTKNGFRFTDLVFDYNYRDLYKKNRFKVSFPFNIMFNTVQGWHAKSMVSYFKDNKTNNYSVSTILNYGFADTQTRITGHVNYQFNDKKSLLNTNFGRQLTEFNDPYSTAPIFNTITSLLLEENNSKFYDKYFAEINYRQEIINGLYFKTKVSFESRKPVFNQSNFKLINWKGVEYSSNNPLEPVNYNSPVINKHDIFKLNLDATITFNQKHILIPNNKINLPSNYPKLNLNYTKGISLNEKKYNFDYIEARVFQNFKVRNKGVFAYNIKAGQFINKDNLSFVDYKHFDITQVHVSIRKNYTNHFALMPLYGFSTNNQFTEAHAEHNFNGYVLRKIPYINKLQFKLIVGANTLFTHNNKPYSELSIGLNNVGFGKYRFLRVDYVRTFHNNKSIGSFVVGLSL